jgi:ribose transport system permease protein
MKRALFVRHEFARSALPVIVFAFFAVTVSGYASFGNIYSILESCALVGLIAAAVGTTMLAGELDLSVSSVAACAGVIAVKASGLGLVQAVLLATVIGVVFGAIQGWGIHRLAISSLVLTLGTFIGIRGIAYILADERTITLDLDQLGMAQSLRERFWIFSPFSATMLVLVLLVGLLLRYTRVGREIYAIGGGRRESKAAGVPQARGIILAFALSGGLAGLAGAMASIRAGSAAPVSYDELLLIGVTAALIGGVSLYGGRGSMTSVLLGVLTLQFLLSGLAIQGAAFWAANLATGSVLLVAIFIDLAAEDSPARRALDRLRASRQSRAADADQAIVTPQQEGVS